MLKIELEKSGNTLLCRATQRGEELGRAEAEIREDAVWYRSGWLEDSEDYGLLDGLVRATLNHGSLSGAAEADFSALEGQMRDRLNKLGYFQKEPLPIEWFFTSCKPCKGVTE